mmetsp:Transcript_29652/g.74147  ORF Transcript_29652/g.74147 Transcript_29652/m.74147 type:complete len:224 (+) Transcript_29652:102-773(+)
MGYYEHHVLGQCAAVHQSRVRASRAPGFSRKLSHSLQVVSRACTRIRLRRHLPSSGSPLHHLDPEDSNFLGARRDEVYDSSCEIRHCGRAFEAPSDHMAVLAAVDDFQHCCRHSPNLAFRGMKADSLIAWISKSQHWDLHSSAIQANVNCAVDLNRIESTIARIFVGPDASVLLLNGKVYIMTYCWARQGVHQVAGNRPRGKDKRPFQQVVHPSAELGDLPGW